MDSLREVTDILNIRLSEDESYCIAVDQTRLPGELCYVDLRTAEDYYTAIKLLQVRGAPCIGITAGYAMYCLAQTLPTEKQAFLAEYDRLSAYINSSRPTAVNLSWALRRMRAVLDSAADATVAEWVALLGKEAKAIHEEDMAMCRAISEYGLSLLKEGDGVLTHCNAGPLATSRLGTAQGPMFLAKEKGINLRVFADETRPLLQG
ncbi:MAG: S-methyl-5-thioribose-1-phosphate isomerase, partial [Oscillospiraceae bacterium]|nr:S-methyl-5-thioribose-1-phosphate isomerase [Oscillospiraceae bacterium]